MLTLRATANSGSVFNGWGLPTCGTAACQVALIQGITIPATFAVVSRLTGRPGKVGPGVHHAVGHRARAPVRTGKVLAWGDNGTAYLWSATTGFASVTKPYRIYCTGHTFLPDGRLLIMGGTVPTRQACRPRASSTRPQAPGPPPSRCRGAATTDRDDAAQRRGAGRVRPRREQGRRQGAGNLERRRLAQAAGYVGCRRPALLSADVRGTEREGVHGRLRPEPLPGRAAGTGTERRADVARRDMGSAVMYAPGKILYAGGGDSTLPTAAAEMIDLTKASPAWTTAGSMKFPRRQLNATLLADGSVLVTGGTSGAGFNNQAGAVREAELWKPGTGPGPGPRWPVRPRPGSITPRRSCCPAAGCSQRQRRRGRNHLRQQRVHGPDLLATLPVQGRRHRGAAAEHHLGACHASLQPGVYGRDSERGLRLQGDPDPALLRHARVQPEPARLSSGLYEAGRNDDDPERQGPAERQLRAAGALHALHHQWVGRAVDGEDGDRRAVGADGSLDRVEGYCRASHSAHVLKKGAAIGSAVGALGGILLGHTICGLSEDPELSWYQHRAAQRRWRCPAARDSRRADRRPDPQAGGRQSSAAWRRVIPVTATTSRPPDSRSPLWLGVLGGIGGNLEELNGSRSGVPAQAGVRGSVRGDPCGAMDTGARVGRRNCAARELRKALGRAWTHDGSDTLRVSWGLADPP